MLESRHWLPADGGYFEKLLDSLLEGCQILGRDWRYLYLNEAAARHARRSREDLLGRSMLDEYPGIERTAAFASLSAVLESGEPTTNTHEFVYPNGTSAWFELRIQPIPEGLFVMSLDVSGARLAELDLRRQVRRLDALRNIDLAILGTTDWRVTLRTVIHETREQLGVDGALVATLDSSDHRLTLAAHGGLAAAPPLNRTLHIGEGLIGSAALERRTVAAPVLAAVRDADPVEWFGAGQQTTSAYATPLIARGQVIGVLAVSRTSRLDADAAWVSFFETLAGQAAMALDAGRLFADLERTNFDLALAYETTIEGWSRALELRDHDTQGHTARVAAVTVELARAAGIAEQELAHVRRGALLHDIGKMGVPDAILLKAGPLTEEEWATMREHPRIAYELLSPVHYLRAAVDIPYCHHEKWDGTGYPRQLRAEQIPLSARLFTIVDVWDALRTDRPYRRAWDDDRVLQHIDAESGRHFDPDVVQLFSRLLASNPQFGE